jgi:hypothetical protein
MSADNTFDPAIVALDGDEVRARIVTYNVTYGLSYDLTHGDQPDVSVDNASLGTRMDEHPCAPHAGDTVMTHDYVNGICQDCDDRCPHYGDVAWDGKWVICGDCDERLGLREEDES